VEISSGVVYNKEAIIIAKPKLAMERKNKSHILLSVLMVSVSPLQNSIISERIFHFLGASLNSGSASLLLWYLEELNDLRGNGTGSTQHFFLLPAQ